METLELQSTAARCAFGLGVTACVLVGLLLWLSVEYFQLADKPRLPLALATPDCPDGSIAVYNGALVSSDKAYACESTSSLRFGGFVVWREESKGEKEKEKEKGIVLRGQGPQELRAPRNALALVPTSIEDPRAPLMIWHKNSAGPGFLPGVPPDQIVTFK